MTPFESRGLGGSSRRERHGRRQLVCMNRPLGELGLVVPGGCDRRAPPQAKKNRRGGTPLGAPPRRLTRQRAPRHGRGTLHLVIRRRSFLLKGSIRDYFPPIFSLYWAGRGMQVDYRPMTRYPMNLFGDGELLLCCRVQALARTVPNQAGHARGRHENAGGNRGRHLRGHRALRAGVHGPVTQGHPRPPDRRPPRGPPPGRPDRRRTGGDGSRGHRRQGVEPSPRHQHQDRRRGRALHPRRATPLPRNQEEIRPQVRGQPLLPPPGPRSSLPAFLLTCWAGPRRDGPPPGLRPSGLA
jgi:hypothetical protein